MGDALKDNVHVIPCIDAGGTYKRMKSLYDQSGMQNLRDDILKFLWPRYHCCRRATMRFRRCATLYS